MSDNVQNSEGVWRCERPYQRLSAHILVLFTTYGYITNSQHDQLPVGLINHVFKYMIFGIFTSRCVLCYFRKLICKDMRDHRRYVHNLRSASSQLVYTARVNAGFHTLRRTSIPPGWDFSQSRGYPPRPPASHTSPGTEFAGSTGLERDTVRVKYLL